MLQAVEPWFSHFGYINDPESYVGFGGLVLDLVSYLARLWYLHSSA